MALEAERGRIEAVYLAALSRLPTTKEVEKAAAFLDKFAAGDSRKRTEATADVFWALLNSAEFVFNH